VRAVENLLEAQDLHALLSRLLDERDVDVERRLLRLLDGPALLERRCGLNQPDFYVARHGRLPSRKAHPRERLRLPTRCAKNRLPGTLAAPDLRSRQDEEVVDGHDRALRGVFGLYAGGRHRPRQSWPGTLRRLRAPAPGASGDG